INIVSGKDALIVHIISKFRITKVDIISKQIKVSAFATAGTSKAVLDEEIKKGEIRLPAVCAEQNLSFLLTDHLIIKAIAAVCYDSKIAKTGRHNTLAIVKNILGHEGLTSLCDHLCKYKFSLVVDDQSTTKHLFLVVRIDMSLNVFATFPIYVHLALVTNYLDILKNLLGIYTIISILVLNELLNLLNFKLCQDT
ncbi:hypothetical protein BDFB_011107, partial [Asbolus verrucosus]